MKILFISLGCDKNLVDSERMLGLLEQEHFTMTDSETEADVIVVNTCCFIGDAKEESIQNILEMAEYRKHGPCKALIVTGCLAQRYRQEVIDEIPEVDAVLGTNSFDKLIPAIRAALEKNEKSLILEPLEGFASEKGKRLLTTGGHYAYLKIAEGCDKHCTYCIIPKVRGNYRSVPMESLLQEAETLAEQGVKELILVAQETTLYGKDLYGEKSLHKLLKELCKIKGIRWIRILYCYPEEIYPELIQVMKEEKKVCHYLDLPIQHANDTILRRMGRRTTKAELLDIIGTLRKEIPDIVLRTTLITGFPGRRRSSTRNSWISWMRSSLNVSAYSLIHQRRILRQQRCWIRFPRRSNRNGAMRSWSFSRTSPLKRRKIWWEESFLPWWRARFPERAPMWPALTGMPPTWTVIFSSTQQRHWFPAISPV